jgi:uncharacterized protein YcfJ
MLVKNISVVFALGLLVTGCASDYGPKETGGTLLGAVGGALIGSQFGGGTGQVVGAAVGTAAGALAGNYIGKSMDRSDRQEALRYREYQNSTYYERDPYYNQYDRYPY